MPDTVSLLGLSKTSIAVILDLVKDVFGEKTQIRIYTNLESISQPEFPVTEISYETLHHSKISDFKTAFFFGTASTPTRIQVYKFFTKNYDVQKDHFTTIIHPSAYLATSTELDTGLLIEPLCIISSQSKIGFGTFVKRGASIGHHNDIGPFCDINPGATLSGNVKVGEGSIIGTGAVVRDNTSIGRNTIIGAGSVVTKDIPDHVIAYGNPCKVMKTRK